MAYYNSFKNSVKTSLLSLENEIIYFWIWGRKIKANNSGQKLRIKILYIVYYLNYTAWGVTLSPAGFFGKCEEICSLLRIWSYLIKKPAGRFRILRCVRYCSRRCFGLSRQENSWTLIGVIFIRIFSFLT